MKTRATVTIAAEQPLGATNVEPGRLDAACAATAKVPQLRRHGRYGHSDQSSATVVQDHLVRHAAALAPAVAG